MMGVDCVYYAPPGARMRDVADVLAGLCGKTMVRTGDDAPGNEWFAYHAEGVSISPSQTEPGFGKILVEGGREPFYGYETNGPSPEKPFAGMGYKYLRFGSDAHSIAICTALVDFFGGAADFNDCDGIPIDYEVPQRTDMFGEDNAEWDAFQTRKGAVVKVRVPRTKRG